MVAVLAIVMVTVVVGSIALALFLRSYGREEARHEALVLDPATPTVAYAVPNGVDPVVLQVALTHAGFANVVGRVGDAECVVVAYGAAGREAVRGVLEEAHATTYADAEVTTAHVVFQDER
jgi:hypothetical protein